MHEGLHFADLQGPLQKPWGPVWVGVDIGGERSASAVVWFVTRAVGACEAARSDQVLPPSGDMFAWVGV
jgi:hypothetical protein